MQKKNYNGKSKGKWSAEEQPGGRGAGRQNSRIRRNPTSYRRIRFISENIIFDDGAFPILHGLRLFRANFLDTGPWGALVPGRRVDEFDCGTKVR